MGAISPDTPSTPMETIEELCDAFLADVSRQTIIEQHRVVDFILDIRQKAKDGTTQRS